MSASLRPIQSAANAGGLSVHEQQALIDMRPIVLQNFMQNGATYSVTSSTALANVGNGTQASIAAGSQLAVQINASEAVTCNGMWQIEGELYLTGVLVGIGIRVALPHAVAGHSLTGVDLHC